MGRIQCEGRVGLNTLCYMGSEHEPEVGEKCQEHPSGGDDCPGF